MSGCTSSVCSSLISSMGSWFVSHPMTVACPDFLSSLQRPQRVSLLGCYNSRVEISCSHFSALGMEPQSAGIFDDC